MRQMHKIVENHRFILGILGLCEKHWIVITIRGFSSASWGFFCACALSQRNFNITCIAWAISLKLWAFKYIRSGNFSPQGGTLKFSVYIGEADIFGVKILNFRIFLGFQKN